MGLIYLYIQYQFLESTKNGLSEVQSSQEPLKRCLYSLNNMKILRLRTVALARSYIQRQLFNPRFSALILAITSLKRRISSCIFFSRTDSFAFTHLSAQRFQCPFLGHLLPLIELTGMNVALLEHLTDWNPPYLANRPNSPRRRRPAQQR